jgi:4-methyl-5(b-hydroxyethyl)-thiazole monophosphate biosynthesis
VTGSHGISVTADALIADLDLDAFGAIVLPGGMPGTRHLAADERVLGLVRRLMGQGQTVAAICAAPLVLAAAGVLDGHAYTSHPSVGAQLPGCASSERVVRSRNLFTSRGPGTALEFALALVAHFRGPAVAHQLETAMLA